METSPLFVYREQEVLLPSGYIDQDGNLHKEVIIREMSGEEEDILLDENESKNGTNILSVLGRLCRLKNKPTLKFVSDLIMVDQLYLLIQTRVITYGKDYKFEITCSDDLCKKITRVNLDLNSLEFKGSPNPNSLFETIELKSGIEIKFKKNQGKDQVNLNKLANNKSKDKISQILQYRIVEIIKDGESLSKDIVKSLPGQERKLLREKMNSAEGKAETSIDIECVHCSNNMKVEVPLGADFFCLKGEED